MEETGTATPPGSQPPLFQQAMSVRGVIGPTL